MTSTKAPQNQPRVAGTAPSRPGIKFVLVLVAVAIVVAIVVLRG